MLAAIPDGVVALAAGTVLALGAAALVLAPLLRGDEPAPRPAPPPDAATRTATAQASAIEALREIEFDRATGKLSDDDYRDLKASYTGAALAELRAKDAAASGGPAATIAIDDATLERTIRAFRGGAHGHAVACAVCGPRPEPDATFCSECGRFLAAQCAACGAACEEEGQRYCGDCGTALAA